MTLKIDHEVWKLSWIPVTIQHLQRGANSTLMCVLHVFYRHPLYTKPFWRPHHSFPCSTPTNGDSHLEGRPFLRDQGYPPSGKPDLACAQMPINVHYSFMVILMLTPNLVKLQCPTYFFSAVFSLSQPVLHSHQPNLCLVWLKPQVVHDPERFWGVPQCNQMDLYVLILKENLIEPPKR